MTKAQKMVVVILTSAVLGLGLGSLVGWQVKNAIQYFQTVQHTDSLVYLFIVGKVEANDDLLAQVLTDKAEGILEPGRHRFPGDAEVMGERYEIKRYTQNYKNGAIFYHVEFFRPSTNRVDTYNVLVIETEDGWLIAKNSSIDEQLMEEAKKDEEPHIVHTYGER